MRGVTYQDALSKEEVKTTMERIEALTEDYLDESANLLVFAFNREPWNESWTFETAKEELRWTLSVPGYEGFVSRGEEISGLATGYCEQEGNRRVFYLRTLCVRPDLQGKGVGSSLLRQLEETLKELNVAGIYLLTRKGGQAEAFYRNNGYEVSSEDVVMIREWWLSWGETTKTAMNTRPAMMLHKAQRSERMAESAGRYCPLCGEAAGLQDWVCRRCGESLQVPARGVGVPSSTFSQEASEEVAHEGRETGSRRHWWRRFFSDERR